MVPGKRSRVPSSSSFSGVANTQPESLKPQGSHHYADPFPEILSISSPEEQSGVVQIGNFLEKCGFCREKLHQSDVFMYGLFGAFCSPECREKQMVYDKFMELCKRVRAKKGRTCGNNAKVPEDHTTTNPESHTVP